MTVRRPLILLVLAALLPLVLLSAVLGVSALRQRQMALRAEAQARVDQITTLLGRDLQSQATVLDAVAQLPAFDTPIKVDEAAEVLRRVSARQPQWLTVVVSDAEGNRLLATPELAPGRRMVADTAAYAEVLASRRPGFGSISTGPPGRQPAIRVPVVRGENADYVLTALLRAEDIRALLHPDSMPPGWIGAVLDPRGRIIARTAYSPKAGFSTASPGALAAMRRAPSGQYNTVSLEGRTMVGSYRVLPGAGWSVHIGIPSAEYNAPLRRAIWLLAVTGTLSLLLAALFVWLMMRELGLRREQQASDEELHRMEALGRMTGGVAHDFNNLLMIVHGSAELLKRRIDDRARVTTYADAILSAAQRGQTLTRQLLAFARRSAYEATAFDLQSRADALQELLVRASRDNIRATVSFAPDTWPILADAEALEIALINLAVNARDAMPEGGELTLSSRNVTLTRSRGAEIALAGDFVALSVQDTGAGIPPEVLPHIFEPFFTTKGSGKGTGLGLSQVYGFARQAGGAVTVFSAPGAGATFTLYLPRAASLESAPAGPIAAEPMVAGPRGRLLLVEDTPEVAEVTASLLAEAGYEVSHVANGEAALERIEAGQPFDVMLSDIVMDGGMTGLELAAQVSSRRPDLPILLMTGYSEDLVGYAGAAWRVLNKPFQQSELVKALDAVRQSRTLPAA